MNNNEFYRRVKEITDTARDASLGQGLYKGTRFIDAGHIALHLLLQLTDVLAEHAQASIDDGK